MGYALTSASSRLRVQHPRVHEKMEFIMRQRVMCAFLAFLTVAVSAGRVSAADAPAFTRQEDVIYGR